GGGSSVKPIPDGWAPLSPQYGMVFDAGSSHTKLFLYEWPAEKENGTGLVFEIQSCEVKGAGISSYANQPQEAGNSLRECLDQAMKVIPPARQRKTPAFLGATAGMRLRNKTAADQIMEEVAKTISCYPVDFRAAQIISGKEEGGYGWLTINYLLKSFTEVRLRLSLPAGGVLGALDLGGASTQISFIPHGGVKNPNTSSSYQLYGRDYSIYTHSYLCYGQDQARKQVVQRLVVRTCLFSLVLPRHPCYPKDFKRTVNLGEELASPCTNQQSAIQSGPPERVLRGTGNFDQCQKVVLQIFNFSGCQTEHCAFNGIYQPPITGKFYVSKTHVPGTPGAWVSGQTLCILPLQLRRSYPKEEEKRLQNYCGNAVYILTLLLRGYKFTEANWSSIKFKQHAGDSEIGWTLGYVLNLTNSIPQGKKKFIHEFKPWVASIFFISLVLLVAVVLLVASQNWFSPGFGKEGSL
uniref:Ectonucleoside triphosphate diphosphohydrolase 8 n=1 Tax=Ornithorhynchus anatinus TaxID=9258 RepID=A0A6I8N6J6_ORNAN